MLAEYKIFFNYLGQKGMVLKAMPLLILVYIITKEQPPNPILISGLIGITCSFSLLEFSGNVFGLDYCAFYLHYTGAIPAWLTMLKRVAMAVSIQAALMAILSVPFYFKTDASGFRLHVLLVLILVLQNFCTGCLFSAFFPAAVPRNIKNKLLRANPGAGFSLNAVLNFVVVIAFYTLAKLLPEKTAVRCYIIYIVLLPALFIPAAIVAAAKELGRKKYKKWWTITLYD